MELHDVTDDPPSNYIDAFTKNVATASMDTVGQFHKIRHDLKRMDLTGEFDPEWLKAHKVLYDEMKERVETLEAEFVKAREKTEERKQKLKELGEL